jgi:hypothetical protein
MKGLYRVSGSPASSTGSENTLRLIPASFGEIAIVHGSFGRECIWSSKNGCDGHAYVE